MHPPIPADKTSSRKIAAACIAYAILLAFLAARLSLWLDEVLQLIGTRGQSFLQVVRYVRVNPGAAPLGYLLQAAFVNGMGFSPLAARLPSILCSALTCWAICKLARSLTVSPAWTAMAAFILLPLQFRYALEGRPYSLALMFSAFSTLLLLELVKNFTWNKVVVYGLSVALGLYSQPFSLFVPLSHIAWATYRSSGVSENARLRNRLALATGLASLPFTPWFFYVRGMWHAALIPIAAEGQGFHFTAKLPLMLFREISGASYWGGSLLAIGVAFAVFGERRDRQKHGLLLLTIAMPIASALIADAWFGYFIAIRQMIFVLPALALLSARGLQNVYRLSRFSGWVFATAFVGLTVWYDAGWFQRPREDWKAAAHALAVDPSACIVPVPFDSLKLYTFFEPELPRRVCGFPAYAGESVMVALSPLSTAAEKAATLDRLASLGFHADPKEFTVGMTELISLRLAARR